MPKNITFYQFHLSCQVPRGSLPRAGHIFSAKQAKHCYPNLDKTHGFVICTMIYTSLSLSLCKSNAFLRSFEHSKAPRAKGAWGFCRFFPCPSFPFPLWIYTSYLNNSHRLLFSPNVPRKRPTMSYCSHQMDSWMQQVRQLAGRPVWCCLLRHGPPFFPGTLSSSEHWAVCSLGVGWKWGTGKPSTSIPRGTVNYQLPSSLPLHLQQPRILYAVALLVGFWRLPWSFGSAFWPYA